MSAKPPQPPAYWGSNPSANLAEPGTTRRGLGWGFGERVLDGHLNQLLKELDLARQYLLEGALSGDHTLAGSLAITPASPASALLVLDAAIRARWGITRHGFQLAPVAELVQPWAGASLPSPDWAVTTLLGGPVNAFVSDPTALVPWRHVYLTTPASSAAQLRGPLVTALGNASAIAVDAAVHLTVTSGDPLELALGLYSATSPSEYLGVSVDSDSSATAYVATAGTAAVPAGAWAPGGLNHLRLEVEGSSVSGLAANTFRLRASVNGVSSGFVTFAESPGAPHLYRPFLSVATVAGATGTLRAGAIRTQWIAAP